MASTLYPVHQYTEAQWLEYSDAHMYDDPEEDVVDVIWKRDAVCMDIMANGTRIIPILRKLERTMQAAGLATTDDRPAPYSGWFGAWADSLADKTEKPYFIWNYDGREDVRRGCWSYSWGIEQHDDRWYIFLNIKI